MTQENTTEAIFKGLAEPFPAEAVKFRAQGRGTQMLAYIEARDVMHRLDQVVGPENWRATYRHQIFKDEVTVMCELSLRINGEWITKEDGAENTQVEGAKGGISDALKRAAVTWGIGRYLYYLPKFHQGQNGGRPILPKWAQGPAQAWPPLPSDDEQSGHEQEEKPAPGSLRDRLSHDPGKGLAKEMEREVESGPTPPTARATDEQVKALGKALTQRGATFNDTNLLELLGVKRLDKDNVHAEIGRFMADNDVPIEELIRNWQERVEAK